MHICVHEPAHTDFQPYYTIYSGHSCSSHLNTVIGGHASLTLYEESKDWSGGHLIGSHAPYTALVGATHALNQLPKDGRPTIIITSSGYVVDGIQRCKDSWPKRNWKHVKNVPEWQALLMAGEQRDILWRKHTANGPCDYLNAANDMAKEVIIRHRSTHP